MAKVRVYELAKELGVESKTVLSLLKDMGEFVRSASSTVEAPVERRLKEKLASEPPPAKKTTSKIASAPPTTPVADGVAKAAATAAPPVVDGKSHLCSWISPVLRAHRSFPSGQHAKECRAGFDGLRNCSK